MIEMERQNCFFAGKHFKNHESIISYYIRLPPHNDIVYFCEKYDMDVSWMKKISKEKYMKLILLVNK